ncbi:MAG: glycosyltransferase [bacterium]
MKIKRLLMVTEPSRNGVFAYVADLIRHAHRYHPEIIVDLAYSSQRSSEKLFQIIREVEARGGQTVDLKTGNAPRLGDFRATLRLHRLILNTRPDLIHAHSSKAGALCRILRWLHLPSVPPVVYTPNAYFGLGQSKSRFLFNWIESWLGRTGLTINCSSDERAFGLRSLGLPPRHLALIYHGVDQARFFPSDAETKKLLRRNFGLPEEKPILLTIGRDSAQKNYPPLYAALNQLLNSAAPPFLFAHAGAGSTALRSSLAPQAQQHVFAFEHIAAMPDMLRAVDGFILTSRYEGLSFAMLEALSSGLKLFLTQAPGSSCLKKVGFDEIEWMPPVPRPDDVVASLEKWGKAFPLAPSPNQLQRARQWFNLPVQMEKTFRLYEYAAVGKK